jgi:hypothetical protein
MKILWCCAGWVCLALVICLVECCAPESVPLPSATPLTAAEASTGVPSPTAVPTATPTLEAPTDTPTPSPIPSTRVPRPTRPVLASTMTSDEEYAFVSKMLEDNGGCRLPCWWGFTPGETSWEITKTFFASLGKKFESWSVDGIRNYTVYFDIPDHHHSHGEFYSVGGGGTIEMISIGAIPPADEGGYLYEDPQFVADWKVYMLSQILTNYGQPPQVLLGIDRNTPWTPFDLLLFYPEKGILVQYSGPAERGEDTFRVCPHRSKITLYLWIPEQYAGLEDVPGIGSYTYAVDDMSLLHSWEEATGMSIEQFHQTFIQPDNQTCLETPAELW